MRAISKTNKARRVSNRERKINNIVKQMLDFKEDDVVFKYISSKMWIGSYGMVAYVDESGIDWRIPEEDIKAACNLLDNSTWVRNGYSMYCIPNGVKLMRWGDNLFFYLENGQLYDIDHNYWFNISDSKLLLKWLSDGYNYYNPEDYFWDKQENDGKMPKQHKPLNYKQILNGALGSGAPFVEDHVHGYRTPLDIDDFEDESQFSKLNFNSIEELESHVMENVNGDVHFYWHERVYSLRRYKDENDNFFLELSPCF